MIFVRIYKLWDSLKSLENTWKFHDWRFNHIVPAVQGTDAFGQVHGIYPSNLT